MARPLRIEFPGALYHVTSRGNAREPIFFGDVDRESFLRILGDAIQRCHWVCHAYCLMPNHYHLLVETPEVNLSRGMRQVNGVYTQRFNRTHDRVGHVLQGRFGAVLVERDTHLLELARYVVLNPVRAGLADRAEAYPWSSLRATLGVAPVPFWLETRALLTRFGSRERYLEFVQEGVGQGSPWAGVCGGVLGSDGFRQGLEIPIGKRTEEPEFPRKERLVHREPLGSAFPPNVAANRALRNSRIRELMRSGLYSPSEIGRHLNLHCSTVTRIGAADLATPRRKMQDLTPATGRR